jgi:hypothetical protein
VPSRWSLVLIWIMLQCESYLSCKSIIRMRLIGLQRIVLDLTTLNAAEINEAW